jgi:hypothetical protein
MSADSVRCARSLSWRAARGGRKACRTHARSTDASLLLPVQSAGTAFHIIAWPMWDTLGAPFPAHAAVVATADATVVRVNAPGSLQPGAGLDAEGGSVALDRGDVLLLSSALTSGSDLTGTTITSTAPVLVWAGHGATNVPLDTPSADHIEETVPPDAALDTDYFVVRPASETGEGTGSRAYARLLGTADGTTITVDPPVPGVAATLNENQSFTFEYSVDVHVHASQPIALALFMESSTVSGFTDGDPAQSLALPMHQLKQAFDVAVPLDVLPAWADIVAPTGASITLDATPVSGWTAIGDSGWSVAHVPLCCDSAHHARGDRPFTAAVHAYPTDSYASYWYPATMGIDDVLFRDGFELP